MADSGPMRGGSRHSVFMRRVNYVIRYVESLRRSVTFYRDVIGLRVRIEGDGLGRIRDG